MHTPPTLKLSGDFGFLVFQQDGESFRVGYSVALTSIVLTRIPDASIVQLCGDRHGHEFQPGSMRWLRLENMSRFQALRIECSNTQLEFRGLQFSERADISFDGEQNFLSFSNCDLHSLSVHSLAANNLDFRQQAALSEITAQLRGTHLQARIRGQSWSSVTALEGSSVFLYIEQQFHSRVFEFSKDAHSQIIVEAHNSPQRLVTAEREQWDVEENIKAIHIESGRAQPSYDLELSTLEQPTGRPRCVVCLSALPVYLIQPCTHMCLCSDCAPKYHQHALNNCPMCRGPIQELTRVHLACS